jgi:hypothetical protein
MTEPTGMKVSSFVCTNPDCDGVPLDRRMAVQLRGRVVVIANSQVGVDNPKRYWLDVAGAIPGKGIAWCGAFSLWVLRQATLTRRRWVTGIGYIYVDESGNRTKEPWLPIVMNPQPGDVAYFTEHQHYGLVDSVGEKTVVLVAGNCPTVKRYEVPKSKAAAYYSIDEIVMFEAKRLSDLAGAG